MSAGPTAPDRRAAAREPGQFKRLSVLIATSFVDMIGFMIVLPLIPFYALELHASPATIGWIIAAFSMAQLMSAPLWGWVSDRYGRRPALLIGLTASAAAYVIFGLAHTVWLLFVSRFVQGAGGGTTGVAQAYVADTVRPADRARALGWLSAATSAAVTIGPAIGSFSTHLGRQAPGFVAAALCLVNVGFAWIWLPESHVKRGHAAARPTGARAWHGVWRILTHPRERVSRLILIYGVGMLAFSAFTSVQALYLNAEFHVTKDTIGWFFVYNGVLSFVLRTVLLGPTVDRVGEAWAMRLGAAALILGMVLYPLMPTVWTLIPVMALVPIGTALLFPATTSLVSRFTDAAVIGTTMGVAQTFAGIARVVSPIAATRAFQGLGHAWPYYLAAIAVALVSLLSFQVEVGRTEPTPPAGTPLVPVDTVPDPAGDTGAGSGAEVVDAGAARPGSRA
jgi:MFS family permease